MGKQRTARVWNECYRPFIMGGDVHRPIATTIPVEKPVRLGKGVSVYVITSPKGTTHIAETKTGAFVGTSLESVRRDVREADPAVMRKQIAEARERSKYAEDMEPEEFWSKFR